MRTKLGASTRLRLKMKFALYSAGGIALAGVMIFFIYKNELINRYPFDLANKELKNVNFTVLTHDINSDFEEVRPVITADGKTLFFCRRNHPDNVLKKKDKQDIWVSTLQQDNTWGNPNNLGKFINSRNADAICSVSPDGNEIIFVSEKMNPTTPLMKSLHTKEGWQRPEFIEIENFYNHNAYIDFYYSYKSNVLFMAVERSDSRGEQDLYVSLPKGKNKWSEPVNLGSIVNSGKSDFAPFLSADGETLYFSSYGHNGFGGCDIFQTTRLDNTWKNWSQPVNLGKGINSEREESYFSISGDYKHIYFESYDLKDEVRDIFRADLPESCKPIILPLGINMVDR